MFENLFKPLKVNTMMLKNRVILSSMGIIDSHQHISSTNYGNISLFDKSLGGASLVHISGGDPFSKYNLDVTREQLSVARQAGAQCGFQFGLFGPFGPDQIAPVEGITYNGRHAREMNEEDMDRVIDELADNVVKARDFGFDCVLLHFAHDSLCSLFLSPIFNTRTDEYGGSVENRIRFPKEALRRIRLAVGPHFPIQLRISRSLAVPETYEEDDMLYFLKEVKDYVDMVNVSNGMDCYGGTVDKYEANVHSVPTIFEPHMYNLSFAARVKRECGILVSVVGGVMKLEDGEAAIAAGEVDCIMVGRQSIADPFFVQKAMEGYPEDIVPCIRCMHCYHISTEHYNTVCSVNPRFQRENRVPLKLEKAGKIKHVVVIGGGPAGIKAALVAEERGHRVTLLEKEMFLGGQLKCSDFDDYKKDLKRYRDYLLIQIGKSNVDVRLGVDANPEQVKELHPDALIIAVGAESITPPIKGVEHAIQAVDAYPAIETLRGRIAVIGGGVIGCEIGLEIAERGHQVHIIEISDTLSAQSNWLYKIALRQHMNKCATLTALTKHRCMEMGKNYVIIHDENGHKIRLEVDHIILATGMRSKRDLAESFYGITPEVAMIGDCHKVARVMEATNDAYFIAANL